MNKLMLAVAILITGLSAPAADFLDKLRSIKGTNQSSVLSGSLSQDQMVQGLKEALAQGMQRAVSQLGTTNGFLTNVNVRIPMPDKLKSMEKTLRKLKQERLADEFEQTMNRAAEKAVPVAASVFADAVKQITIEDAKTLLTGPDDAATQYFRKVTQTNLFTKFLPIVKQATDAAGVTSAYKNILDKASGAGSFGSFGINTLLSADAQDIDSYVTQKALEGLFKMIAEEEKRIRENPVARSTDLLKKVFGSVKKN